MGCACSKSPEEVEPLLSAEARLPTVFMGEVVHVYDGRTLIIRPEKSDFAVRVILHNLHVPSLRSKQYEAGIKSKHALRDKIAQRPVLVTRVTQATALVHVDGINLTEYMMHHGGARMPIIYENYQV